MSRPSDDYLGLAEAARLLGMSPRTLLRWIRDGRIPSERDEDGGPRLRRDVLMQYVDPADGGPDPSVE
jgi:excisionase family DNA binding protein